jgi:DNA helicase-2/ATP-dependent DNA helicase PcrA
MAERLETVPDIHERAFIGTMHKFCTEVLANRGKSVGINGLPNIFDSFQDRKQILEDAATQIPECRVELETLTVTKDRNRRLDDWLNFIADQKNNLVVPTMVQDEVLQRLYIEYDAQLRASNGIDFDDLLLLTYRLFQERPKIADFYRRQYKYICIDESQDLNEAQYRVLCALCGENYKNVMMVGDPKQAIFMWNGAHPKYLDLFAKDFDARTIVLQENFRSARLIVSAAKKLDSKYSVDGVLAVEGVVDINGCESEADEAVFVADKIDQLRSNGHPDVEVPIAYESCAVIGRTRFAFREIEKLFKERSIPFYKKVSSSGVRSESALVSQFEIALRLLANPHDRLHLGLLVQQWGITCPIEDLYESLETKPLSGDALFEQLASFNSEKSRIVLESLNAIGFATNSFRLTDALDLLESKVTNLDDAEKALVLEDTGEWRKHWDYYVRSERGGSQSVQGFLSQLALGTTQQPRENGVALLTVHSSKGMEFDVVFLVGMNEGTFPDFRAKNEGLIEEQRNAFVAVTRSRRLLYISYPEIRVMPWGDERRQRPSRYLRMIEG